MDWYRNDLRSVKHVNVGHTKTHVRWEATRRTHRPTSHAANIWIPHHHRYQSHVAYSSDNLLTPAKFPERTPYTLHRLNWNAHIRSSTLGRSTWEKGTRFEFGFSHFLASILRVVYVGVMTNSYSSTFPQEKKNGSICYSIYFFPSLFLIFLFISQHTYARPKIPRQWNSCLPGCHFIKPEPPRYRLVQVDGLWCHRVSLLWRIKRAYSAPWWQWWRHARQASPEH